MWLGDQPLYSPLPLLFAQISIIFASTRITHALYHLGQPQVVSHIIAGLILGSSFLSRNRRVTYREEVVREGAGTVGVIRAMCDDYSLLVVGRRQGRELLLTAGLAMWSEYPELGVIGDILASTDFVRKVSTLVVQQQTRVGDEVEVDSPRSQQGPTGKVEAGVVDQSPLPALEASCCPR